MNMKKYVKRVLVAVMAMVVVLAMAGCGNPTKEAEAAVTDQMDKLVACDFEDSEMESLKKQLDTYNVDADAFMKCIFGNATYKITGSEESGDDVLVTMDVTNVDMQKANDKWMAELKKQIGNTNSDLMKAYKQGGTKALYQEIFEMLMADIDAVNDNGDTKTETITVTVKKGDDGWTPNFTNSDLEKISGNLTEIMQQSMNSL